MGKGGPQFDQEKVNFAGTLANKTPDHVTTWIGISATVYDAEGTKQEVLAETPIWIAPMGEADFLLELPDLKREQFDDIKFCELDDKAPKACVVWDMTEVKGLAI